MIWCFILINSGVSPRISYLYSASVVTMQESNDPYGVLCFESHFLIRCFITYLGVSPRISYLYSASVVTMQESNDPYGVLCFDSHFLIRCFIITYLGVSPRISYLYSASVVTIQESNDPYGVLCFEPQLYFVEETFQKINVTVKRSGKTAIKISWDAKNCVLVRRSR